MGEHYTGFVAEHYDLLVPEDETNLLDIDHEKQTYETTFRYQLIADGELSYQEDRRFLLH